MLTWREEPLSPSEQELLRLTFAAHDKSARRNNCSSAAVANAYKGSGSYAAAVASALLTLGAVHAPIEKIMGFLATPDPAAMVGVLPRIPGWGNDFVKGEPDSDWAEVDRALPSKLQEKLASVTDRLHQKGKRLFPNPGCYTAAVALTLGIPASVAPWIFVQGRLGAWSEIILEASK